MKIVKPVFSIFLMSVLLLAFSACDKKNDQDTEGAKLSPSKEIASDSKAKSTEKLGLIDRVKAANVCKPKDYGCAELKDLKMYLRTRKAPLTLEEFKNALTAATLNNSKAELIRRMVPNASEELLPLVKPYLTHDNFSLRKASLAMTSRIGSDAAISELVALLDNLEKSDTLRTDVPKLLMQHKDNEMVISCLPKLKDMAKNSAQGWGRAYATTAVAVIEGEASIPFLTEISSKDKWNTVRASAVKSMGRIGSEKALPHLKKLTKDEDKKVADAAKRAIQRIKGEKAQAVGKKQPQGKIKTGIKKSVNKK